MTKFSKRCSYSRIEYCAVQALVEQKLAAGFSIKLIFEELTDAGSLTMGYTTFCGYIRGQRERRPGKKKDDSKPGLRQKPNQKESKPAAGIDKSSSFKLEKVRLEDLI